jgi:molybdopterin/thiamine biosynthesis adenylyltransferase
VVNAVTATKRSEYFARVEGRVDVGGLGNAFVLVVGAGSVGSTMALELARSGVGHLLLVDGDRLEPHNLARHVLPDAFVGTNKAEALAGFLHEDIPGLDVAGAPFHLDGSFQDEQIDRMMALADLVVVATDQRRAQRRIASRALAMDIPAIVPGLYADQGGEVFVQLNPGEACFMCWDGFRDIGSEVRSVSSINADAFAVVQQAIFLCLAILQPSLRHTRELAPPPDDLRPRQLFVIRPGAAPLRTPVTRRPGCPGCAVGESPVNREAHAAATASGIAARLGVEHPRAAAAGWRFFLDDARVPPELQVDVDTTLAAEGELVTLSWSAKNATHVVVQGDVQPPEGRREVVVTATGHFVVTAFNPFHRIRASSPVVRVMPLLRIREIRVPDFSFATPNVATAPTLGVGCTAAPADGVEAATAAHTPWPSSLSPAFPMPFDFEHPPRPWPGPLDERVSQ